jgi:hypothetical protein
MEKLKKEHKTTEIVVKVDNATIHGHTTDELRTTDELLMVQ